MNIINKNLENNVDPDQFTGRFYHIFKEKVSILHTHAKPLQLRPTLCDAKDCSCQALSMGFSGQEYWIG